MCFIAFCASSGVKYSIYANPLFSQGRLRSLPNSISFTFPKVVNISSRCSLRTFLVSRPICIFVGWGVAERARFLAAPRDLDRDADFLVRDTERFALRSLDRDFEGDFFLGLGERLRSALFSSPFRSRSSRDGLAFSALAGSASILNLGMAGFSASFGLAFSPLSASFSLGFTSFFFFLSFFLSSLERERLESELEELLSLLLSLELLLLELLCFLFFLPLLSLLRPFRLSSSLLLELLESLLLPRFFFFSSFSASLLVSRGAAPAIVCK